GNPQFADNGISNQRMGGKHAGREETGVKIIPQKIKTNRKTNGQGDDKCKKSKQKALVPVRVKIVQIQFQTCYEHYIKKANGRKKINGRILFENAQSMGTDNYSGYDQSNNSWNA